MADFFTFLGTLINSYVKPVFQMLSDSRIAQYLGTSLLTVAVGFFVIRWLYNVFMAHPDSVGSSGFSSAIRFVSTDRVSKRENSVGFSSAYRNKKS